MKNIITALTATPESRAADRTSEALFKFGAIIELRQDSQLYFVHQEK